MAVVLATWWIAVPPVASGLPADVSGSFEGDGHTLTYTVTGVEPDENDQPYNHTGTVTSDTVTVSGTATFTIGEGLVTNLSMGASLSVAGVTDQASWPPEGVDGRVGDTTITFPFSLTVEVPEAPEPVPGAEPTPGATPVPWTTATFTVYSRNCNDWGVCGGPSASGTFQVFDTARSPAVDWVAVTGAAAAAAAAAALAGRAGSSVKPGQPVGYVLQLNQRTFRVSRERPATLQATAWRVDASGAMAPAPEAALRVEVPPGVPWLRVLPPQGAGTLAGQIVLTDSPGAEQMALTVVASAPNGEIVEGVSVTVEAPHDYRAELF